MQIDLTDIRNIIFDLGNVLLNLDFNASVKAFRELGLNRDVVDDAQVYSDPVFYELSTGKISPEKFREQIRSLLKNQQVTDKELDRAWCAMILDVPVKRVKMLQQLNENYKVYLFSNTNQIHIDKLHKDFYQQYQFEFPSLFEKCFYSHEIHEYKPDLSSYLKVIELAGINPEETLFIDDLEENIEGAKKAGLKAFWLKDKMEVTEILPFR